MFGPQDCGALFADFFDNLYLDKEFVPPPWIFRINDDEDSASLGSAIYSGENVMKAAKGLSVGKTCSEDMMVAEMLHALPADVFDVIGALFCYRFLGKIDTDNLWTNVEVILLAKENLKFRTCD